MRDMVQTRLDGTHAASDEMILQVGLFNHHCMADHWSDALWNNIQCISVGQRRDDPAGGRVIEHVS
jgi:hypothetical protein